MMASGTISLSFQGTLDFAELRDSSGQVQLFAGAGWTDRYEAFTALSLGDWVGARGEVVRTRRGELSVRVAEWALLAEARRGFGDKWRGVTDVDTRYRQREVDLWANPDTRRVFLLRSRVLHVVREFLDERDFVEVETPTLHLVPSGGHALPFRTHHNALDLDLFLRIALELHLKRLIIGGFERVFEIGRVFRNEGISPRHNPEFTMLELYQAYADYTDMMALTEEMVAGVVGWLDLESPAVEDDLAGLLEHAHARKLVAIRDLAQYKDDVEWLGRADVISALQLLGRHGLTYDLLTLPPQLPAALQAVTACPDTTFVLDHMSKPYIAAGEIEPWRRAVRALAARPNVACKVSGMFTEADWDHWTTEQFRPYVDELLEAFGPGRLMFGSDWPVSTLAATYEQVVDVAERLTATLSADEQAEFWAGTATRFYRLTT